MLKIKILLIVKCKPKQTWKFSSEGLYIKTFDSSINSHMNKGMWGRTFDMQKDKNKPNNLEECPIEFAVHI